MQQFASQVNKYTNNKEGKKEDTVNHKAKRSQRL